jgi:putative redox protein
MEVKLELDRKMRIIGDDGRDHETIFDTVPAVGGEDTAATPMSIMLQAMGACSFMDTISILRKKRKQIDNLVIKISAERADKHPKVFTKVHLSYELTSPDAELKDLDRSVELSQDKYCGASAMFKQSGCEVTFDTKVIKP